MVTIRTYLQINFPNKTDVMTVLHIARYDIQYVNISLKMSFNLIAVFSLN